MNAINSVKTHCILFLLCLIILLFFSGCTMETDLSREDSRDLNNNTTSFIYNMIPENANAQISVEYSEAINTFSVNLLKKVYIDPDIYEKNLVLSPFSIGRNLAVLTEGATGESRQQLLDALGGEVALNDATDALSELLYADESVILQCADGLWINSNYTLKPSFRTLINSKYGVEIAESDFSNASATVNTVNSWVSSNTNNKINNILSVDDITLETVLLLVNAIYFEADWASPFDITKTVESGFNTPAGTVLVDMMMSDYRHKTYKTSEYENVKLYYGTSEKDFFYLDVYMPTTISIEDFIENRCLSALSVTDTATFGCLKMPKFFFTTKVNLIPMLEDLGIVNIFDPVKSELTEIVENSALFVQNVIHEAGMKTDEEGTKAYAATISIVGETSAEPNSPDVVLNRPFVYFIRAGKNGLVLFSGVVNNPSEM